MVAQISKLNFNTNNISQSSETTKAPVQNNLSPLKADKVSFSGTGGNLAKLSETALAEIRQHIPNFAEVISGKLSRGLAPGPEGVKALKKNGFDIIIDLRESNEISPEYLKAIEESGIKRIHHDLRRDLAGKRDFMKEVLELVKDDNKSKIFIHCVNADATGRTEGLVNVIKSAKGLPYNPESSLFTKLLSIFMPKA